jgi:hypothetical protein
MRFMHALIFSGIGPSRWLFARFLRTAKDIDHQQLLKHHLVKWYVLYLQVKQFCELSKIGWNRPSQQVVIKFPERGWWVKFEWVWINKLSVREAIQSYALTSNAVSTYYQALEVLTQLADWLEGIYQYKMEHTVNYPYFW